MTYEEYYNQWQLSTESRDMAFDEWLCLMLDRQKKMGIDKACEVYEKELRQMKRILNEIRDGAGKIISVGGSLTKFRKAMEE